MTIADLKKERREINAQIGELQRKKKKLDIQIAVTANEERKRISPANLKRIMPMIAAGVVNRDPWCRIANRLNFYGYRCGDKLRFTGVAVRELWEK